MSIFPFNLKKTSRLRDLQVESLKEKDRLTKVCNTNKERNKRLNKSVKEYLPNEILEMTLKEKIDKYKKGEN
ncbi:MAG: hypothetical protein RSC92_03560 [Clostridia bacterium]